MTPPLQRTIRRAVNGPFQDALANEFCTRADKALHEIAANIAARRRCTIEDVFAAVAVAARAEGDVCCD